MNAVLADLLATGRITRSDGTTIPLHSSISQEEGEALQRLILKPRLAHLIEPAILTPDAALGLPTHDLVAFVKVGDDLLGDGSAGSRRWDQHVEF